MNNSSILTRGVTFRLPPKVALRPNGPDDPLPYYYHPLVGPLYKIRIKKSLSLLTPPYNTILEIGYGSGVLLPTLVSIGNVVYGIDIISNPFEVVANLERMGVNTGNITLLKGDFRNANFLEDGICDLIVGISIFEHIKEKELPPVLYEIFRILKSGGEFLVGFPRVDFIMGRFFTLIGYHKIEGHHVINYYQFLKEARDYFELVKCLRTPFIFPLYYSMLFKKKY